MPRKYIPQALDNMDKARPNDRATSAQRAMTLEEIAEIFGTSRERIRQIEQSALRKLRIRLRAKGIDLKDYFENASPNHGAEYAYLFENGKWEWKQV